MRRQAAQAFVDHQGTVLRPLIRPAGSVTTVASVVNRAAAAAMLASLLNIVANMLRMDRRHRAQARGHHSGQVY
jgi:hypothetical protein